ncbi:MAG: long-chain fatty acid--CoA ligase [Afipia sp.]|nr:long-chain fatty acid--CoA ligase [Afipia sp.]
MQTNNLAFAVLDRARRHPDTVAFVVAGRTISYARVADLMVNFARRMQQLGIDRQSVVGLAITDTATAITSALALALLGSRWVQVSRTSPTAYSAATHVLATGAAARLPGRIEIGKDWFDAPRLGRDVPFAGHASPDDTWMIAHSSGTTGRPKFMPLTYGTIWRRFQNPELQDGIAPVTFNLFPPTSYVGSKIGIGNLILGGTNVAPAPFDTLVRIGVTRVMGSPAQIANTIVEKTPVPQSGCAR